MTGKASAVSGRWVGLGLLGLGLGLTSAAEAQANQTFATPVALVQAMIAHERESSARHERYEYMSNERSDRTGGHLWTELVVETSVGRVRRLLAEDGKPLSPERVQAQKAKLDGFAADPDAFARSEQATKNDEEHARQMLDGLTRGFILEHVRQEGGVWKLDYRPDPNYSPSGVEERVLHGMSGSVTIDARELRLIHVDGTLPTDVSIFGFLGTIHAGSHFSNDRAKLDGHWRTVHTVTNIRGKVVLFKTVARNSDLTRSDFVYLKPDITVPEAVALVEKGR